MNNTIEAFKILKITLTVTENEINSLENQKIQSLNLISFRFGKPESILKIKEQNIPDAAFRETYLVKFKYTAIKLDLLLPIIKTARAGL